MFLDEVGAAARHDTHECTWVPVKKKVDKNPARARASEIASGGTVRTVDTDTVVRATTHKAVKDGRFL